jgi:type IV pilus assembly protein PilY1
MDERHSTPCTLVSLLLAYALLVPSAVQAAQPVVAPPPLDAGGDDIFLIQSSVAPNVILLIDNSESMGHIEWHPAFDQTSVPTCAAFTDGTNYIAEDLALTYGFPNADEFTVTECGNTRKIYDPAKNDAKIDEALWWGRYLNWYFSDAADPYVNEIETALSTGAGCKGQEFPDLYRRTRFQASKQVLLDTLCVAESKNVRFGLATFREAADPATEDPNGGFIVSDLGRSNPNHAAELEAAIKLSLSNDDSPDGADETPLAEALFQVYTYWMSRTLADLPTSDQNGDSVFSTFPRYQYDKDGIWQANSNKWLDDAMLYECEKAFVVIVTDGLPTRDDFDEEPADTAYGYADFLDLIGNYHADAETEDPGAADEGTFYLDDIAKYMYDHDFRPDLAGDQTIDTYTVGFATDAAADALLDRTAELGNGLSFQAKDGEELASQLVAALNDIIEKAASFTAASVPSARTADGADFYQSYFFPLKRTAIWEGHIRAWHITAAGDIHDKNGVCALDDPTPGECDSGLFLPDAEFFWDAAEQVPQPDARKLYVSKSGVSSGALPPAFTQANLAAADLLIDPFAIPPDPTPNSLLYPIVGSQALNEEGLADEIVAAVRGCFFGSGVDVPSTDVLTPGPCLPRPARLGDVFHSNPVVVRRPRQPGGDASYKAFKSHYAARTRVLYAGTNSGFLEGIHAGTFDVPTQKYDEGTGAEIFGFMPWESRLTVKHMPIDAATKRHHYVDGDVNSADVWIHPSPTANTRAADGSEWRTILAGSLREGGHHFYALDVTNPDGITAADGGAPLAYPGYVWEFPTEADPDGDLALMGETWSKPILTRVKVKIGADDNGGAGYERWVAIVTGGYAPKSDPNPDTVTGIASSYDAAATEGRAIFILDLKTGEVLAEKKFDTTATDGQQDMRYSVVATPTVLDLNFDGFADVVYAVDMGGQVFKWTINKVGEDRVNDASGLRTQPNWPFKVFFRAAPKTISGDVYFKNLFFSPAAAYSQGKLWLAFGSGERRNLPFNGIADDVATPETLEENNRFYVIVDPDPYETAGVPFGTFDETDLTDFTGSQAAAAFANQGFFFSVGDGEKFVTNVEIFAGDVIAASFLPTPSPSPCDAKGRGTLHVFDLVNGEGHFDDGAGNPVRGLDIGAGLPTDPKMSVGVGGTNNRVIIEKSGGDLESFEEDDINVGRGLLYWRERF